MPTQVRSFKYRPSFTAKFRMPVSAGAGKFAISDAEGVASWKTESEALTNVVFLTGAQTITGIKTFSFGPTIVAEAEVGKVLTCGTAEGVSEWGTPANALSLVYQFNATVIEAAQKEELAKGQIAVNVAAGKPLMTATEIFISTFSPVGKTVGFVASLAVGDFLSISTGVPNRFLLGEISSITSYLAGEALALKLSLVYAQGEHWGEESSVSVTRYSAPRLLAALTVTGATTLEGNIEAKKELKVLEGIVGEKTLKVKEGSTLEGAVEAKKTLKVLETSTLEGLLLGESGGGIVPLEIASGKTYTVSANKQTLYGVEIINNGELIVTGELKYV